MADAFFRRSWITGTLASAALLACKRSRQSHAENTSSVLQTHLLTFNDPTIGLQKAVVIVPTWGKPNETFPLLLALHGRGEANHGLDVGAWGWTRDYWLDRAVLRARQQPLDVAALLGITDNDQLTRLNQQLPYQGLIIACPYTPDVLGKRSIQESDQTIQNFAKFLENQLLPTIKERYPVAKTLGIDGVSLGGRVALLTSMERPQLFNAVGTLQAAIRETEIGDIVHRAQKAFQNIKRPLRLLTSTEDPFRKTLEQLAKSLEKEGIGVELRIVPGPHDYAFNRGPGSYEMILWHDQRLRRNEVQL